MVWWNHEADQVISPVQEILQFVFFFLAVQDLCNANDTYQHENKEKNTETRKFQGTQFFQIHKDSFLDIFVEA